MYENYQWEAIVTPIIVDKLEHYLNLSGYDVSKTRELVKGFKGGFDIGYRGPRNRRDTPNNIPLKVGSKVELWNKIMNEVKVKRYAGPYSRDQLPFDYFVQSPVGLVPKANGKTRLIFHLSYDFGPLDCHKSINHHTPDELCTVKYKDLDHAIKSSLEILKQNSEGVLVYSKSDATSAFRVLPILPEQCQFLVMMAFHPVTNQQYFFIDLCLPFGASISCATYQAFSDALSHITQYQISSKALALVGLTNYLDDFLFIALYTWVCNSAMQEFFVICSTIGCPLSLEKTEYASELKIFLGVLLNGRLRRLFIPIEKNTKALNLLNWAIDKRKVTVKFVQQLTGMLNFLQRVIVPGRVFTRRMYDKLKPKQSGTLKSHHHVWLDREFLLDCRIWKNFLEDDSQNMRLCRSFVDFSNEREAVQLDLASDASLNPWLGMGAIFGNSWIVEQWPEGFIKKYSPSIEFLELFALVSALLTWRGDPKLNNARVVVWCDNEAVVHMINNTASSCSQCMKLLRIVVIDNLRCNRRLFARHIRTHLNILPDALSRLNFKKFWENAPKTMKPIPDRTALWPVNRVFESEFYQLRF